LEKNVKLKQELGPKYIRRNIAWLILFPLKTQFKQTVGDLQAIIGFF